MACDIREKMIAIVGMVRSLGGLAVCSKNCIRLYVDVEKIPVKNMKKLLAKIGAKHNDPEFITEDRYSIKVDV